MPSSSEFSPVAESLDPAMAIVTTADGDERAGCLVGFHSQCSIEPFRYAVWLSKANHTYRVATRAPRLAVHFLAREQHALAEHFGGTSGDDLDKFSAYAWQPGPDGVPLLADCPNRMVGHRGVILDESSDHVCVILHDIDVTAAATPFDPLRLSMVTDITPGHTVEERPRPPTERAE